ncbi:MAG: aldehyde dehydrogenase [Dechloromonas sp.]|jgi:4-guanidinobutyraldehyde dehydrogenase/NAD-dependent aldehyde dehydrogenase|nr:aldehyde dehydrogenase [Xanthomonadales bacterium]TXI75964.1 MAG: aldehyde dehydrogenase [Dechloromonas sp.]HRD71746.1 aldehyde dehydrogenase [Aquimonas sp.]HRF54738.1 aldehyde dehydrogenase [Aquimonas sp.]
MSTSKSCSEWQALSESLNLRTQAFVDGRYVDAASGKSFECRSPIDGRLLATVAECEQEDVNRAVAVARQRFEQGVWSETKPTHRKRVLQRFAQLIEQHAEELALLESLDMGKPVCDAFNVDLSGTIRCMNWTAEAIDKVFGEVAPTGPGELGLVTREPLGVVAAIVPWNFPLLMATWKIAPALAMGNSVILKPSEKSPLSAIRLAELAIEAGVPAGVFNVLPGFGKGAGEPLALHMDVDGLVFTGSTAVGKHLLQCAGRSNMKRAFMECGGKSPNIVFPDAPNLRRAAEAAAIGIFFNQGEVCTAASRLLVHRDIKDEFLAEVAKVTASLHPVHPFEPNAPMGALVDEGQTQRVLNYIDIAQREGGRVVCGGERVHPVAGGCYIAPTIIDGVQVGHTVAREEIFGPVLSVLSFTDEAEAVRIANDTDYGLAAAVFTNDISRAHRVARKLRAGSVWVNYWDGGDMTAPFGGFKQSGNGRDKSLHAFEKYTEIKATWINLEP